MHKKKAKRYIKFLLLVLPKKFLFTANRPYLGPKLLVVEAYFKEFFTSGSIKVLKKHTSNASQVNGEICPLSFEI